VALGEGNFVMTRKSTNVAVIGAGYAGLTAALRLWKKGHRRGVRVTLIAPNRDFNEQVRMQDAAVGSKWDSLPITQVLQGTGIAYRCTRLTGLLAGDRITVQLADGTDLQFDRVILACGWNFGPTENAQRGEYWPSPLPLNGSESAAMHLRALTRGTKVAILGGGTTGVELAGAVADLRPDVEVMLVAAGRAGAFKGPRIERILRDRLRAKGVKLIDGVRGRVDGPDGDALRVAGLENPVDVVLHATGGTPPAILNRLNAPRDSAGSILVDRCLRTLDVPTILAAGDCLALAEPPATPYRKSAFTALVTGAHAADNILRDHRGRPMRPFGFAWYGQGISLGGRDGVGFNGFPNDRPVGPIFTGAAAWHLRNFFVALLRRLVLAQKSVPWMLYWFPFKGAPPRSQRRMQKTTGPTGDS